MTISTSMLILLLTFGVPGVIERLIHPRGYRTGGWRVGGRKAI